MVEVLKIRISENHCIVLLVEKNLYKESKQGCVEFLFELCTDR